MTFPSYYSYYPEYQYSGKYWLNFAPGQIEGFYSLSLREASGSSES